MLHLCTEERTMTHEEKKQIGKMRAAGMSYTRIAEALDISINSVKSYCQRHGLGAGSAPETHPEPVTACQPQSEAGACEQCGSPVLRQAGRKRRRFCSDTCRQAWWASHRGELRHKTEHHFVCEYCGIQFSRYGVSQRRFCSRSCAASARNRRLTAHDA